MNTPSVFIHEIGGIETHVHLCVSIAPTVLISDFIGKLKGSSSHEVNQKLGYKSLEWQSGYGVVSFGTKDLSWVCGYVRDQKKRHASGRVEERLERITEVERQAEPPAAGELSAAEAEQREAPLNGA